MVAIATPTLLSLVNLLKVATSRLGFGGGILLPAELL